MFVDLVGAFRGLFTERRSRIAVLALLLTMAAIPVAELGVIRTFSKLIIDGPGEYRTDRHAVVVSATVFFAGFALTRGLHHLVRFWRVRVFRRGFESSGLQRTHGTASWEWAQSFELSTVTVGLVQVVTFSALFLLINPVVGLVNAVLCAAAVGVIGALYKRQLAKQTTFAEEGTRPGSTAVSQRIATRVFAAEFGSVIATASMALMMLVVLWRTVTGRLSGSDGVVLFLGLRLLYGHLGALAPSVMRFARDSVRRRAAQAIATATALDVAEESLDAMDSDEGAEDGARPARLTRRRTELLTHVVMAGQRGETAEVRDLSARLAGAGKLSVRETCTLEVANSFAAYADLDGGPALPLVWWPRPFPGNFGDWLSPFVLQRAARRPVQFRPPTAPSDAPSLVMIGSIAGFVRPGAVVIGTGVAHVDGGPHPDAQYVSVRGPLTAQALRRSGGPDVDSHGDPALLLSRLLPIDRSTTNGRLALVRHHGQAHLPINLPEGMDEHSVLTSAPEDIAGFVAELCRYDGVITSALHVLATCHSYGIPCAPVTFRGFEGAARGSSTRFHDYALGAGLEDTWQPEPVGLDLRPIEWTGRLRSASVSGAKLDEIEAAIARGVKEYEAAAADFGDDAAFDEDDDAV